MFGIDKFVISKPKEIKTVATNFTDSFKRASSEVKPKPTRMDSYTHNNNGIKKVERIEFDHNKISSLNSKLENGELKQEQVKPFARNFLNKINSLSSENENNLKLIFSYDDDYTSGSLSDSDEKIKIVVKERYDEEKEYNKFNIKVFKFENTDLIQEGLHIQTKGWGNTKELAILNALKSAFQKLSFGNQEVILFRYNLSIINKISPTDFECKVKITPGKIV